ncbi:MAG TPA: hypothetical protein VGJ93_09030 [Desulfuromonadaceae bacterium]|jgi:hypothetical protein
MKIKILLSVLAMLSISSLAFGDEVDNRFQARKYLHDSKMSVTTSIDQAYTQDAILVVGEGVPKKGTTGGQKRLTAKTAAKVVAQRRLAELLEGVTVVSEATVKDSELASDVIKTTVTGFIKNTQVVMEDWNEKDETALVIIKVGMSGPKGFAAVMYEKILT